MRTMEAARCVVHLGSLAAFDADVHGPLGDDADIAFRFEDQTLGHRV
jgi:hypothetical protein